MSTPRIPPVPPNKGGELDKTAPSSQHRKVEKVEKISKVSEVDDESRAKQFRQFVDNVSQEEDEELPTPFSLIAKGPASTASMESVLPPSQDPALGDADEDALPSPGASPPPSSYLSGMAAEDESEEPPPLPRSQQFWESVEEPSSSQPPMQPQMEEKPRSASRVFLKPEEMGKKGKTPELGKKGALKEPGKKTPSPFGPPGKPTMEGPASKEESEFEKGWGTLEPKKGDEPKEKRKRPAGPEGVIAPKGDVGIKYIGSLTAAEKKAEESGLLPQDRIGALRAPALREERPKLEKKEAGARKAEKLGEKREAPSLQEPEQEWESKKRGQKEKEEPMQIESPTTALFPDFYIPMAHAAAAAAKPYLGPEALSIYFHMVGTITAMVSPKGDSRTEFVLNAPSFADSKFYGATISIERFATAPYQLNIVLTGSSEAVNAFNQNIPNLYAAFQNGNFSFTVNRIEAAYAKPLFRRKESAGEKEERDKGFGGEMGNRKRE
jgi:hypothetical protein